jgi:hypothetical protein
MAMQDNGRSPNERPSLISSTPIPGTVNSTAQDRKELSKGCTETAKAVERAVCDGKNGAYERDNAMRLSGRDEKSCPSHTEPESQKGMPKLCRIEIYGRRRSD